MPEETAAASTAESMEEKPCSSSAADSSVDVSEEAKKLIGTGKRHLVMGDVVSAVSVFQEACAMLAEKYGDTADECGEAFFLCGKAILELARMENTVLGNALEGVPEESSEEGEKPNDSKIESADNLDEKTRDELRAQVYDAMSEDQTRSDVKEVGEGEQNQEEVEKQEKVDSLKERDAASPKTEKPAEHKAKLAERDANPAQDEEKRAEHEVKPAEKDAVKSEGVDESSSMKEDVTVSNEVTEKAEKVEKSENKENEEPMEEDGGNDDDDDDEDSEDETKDKESEEDEVGNLQLAWEMLEVSKVIYKRQDRKEDQLMAAQIYLKLGEVGAESGNYTQALEDFNECLTLQLKHLPSHSRLLAETHYQLGTTYIYTAQYSQAIEHFSSSIKVIESRLAMLQEVIDKSEGAEAAKEEKSELEELKLLLPEITEKIEDAKEGQRTAAAASEAIHQTLAGASTSSAFPAENGGPSSSTASQIPVRPADGASSSKSASDISHLVRKKRKPDDESPKKDSDAKKTKQETTINGSGDSAHNGNGVQEKMEQEATSSSVETSV
ncbi:histone-binding protein N1/N2-like isoform X2 [Carassius gibelio]|uniref:histone-binding protein N1/N2-like isoform X2 n=1 Tax=Carassius gibelio TaxID=101364 RepID=UPI002279863F|nr:histone-binding protein N1/N2-like isoform X2 [Carassius gibelio]